MTRQPNQKVRPALTTRLHDPVDGGLTAGAPEVIPARVPNGDGLIHLARTEARRRRTPALKAVCAEPGGLLWPLELERVPAPGGRLLRRWLARRRLRWCAGCAAYRDHLSDPTRKATL